ncbi:CAP domain-containing protein [Litorisediminicola beolgyonensis]|uniref:CAP domain-containing protein n=1 Tax=Litorisediminicola beolgyonensis TaxID=1173614 RepID=A0ABW3ZPU3_9RHOB
MTFSAAEQYMLELVNRARLDPKGEIKRYDISSVNDDLPAGTLSTQTKQVLAPEALLHASSQAHSGWMLDNDVFSHTGAGGSSSNDRMREAGYNFTGSWKSGENLAWSGSTGAVDIEAAVESSHRDLMLSASHRKNILKDEYREIGIALEEGDFNGYNAAMITQNYAVSGRSAFVTGVAYDDADRDEFYSMGEGRGGVIFQSGSDVAETARAGGYALELAAEMTEIMVGWSGGEAQVQIDLSGGNAKLDLVGDMLASSVDLVIQSGNAGGACLLGVDDLDLTGGSADETLEGNDGDNVIDGGAGDDTINTGKGDDAAEGGAGRDKIKGQKGDDTLSGGDDNDKLIGQGGNDTLLGGAGRDKLKGGGGRDRLEGGADNDVVIGQKGSDIFVFRDGDGSDKIKKFDLGDDTLLLDADLWGGGMSADEVVDTYGEVKRGNIILDFGDGDEICFKGEDDLSALADDISFL